MESENQQKSTNSTKKRKIEQDKAKVGVRSNAIERLCSNSNKGKTKKGDVSRMSAQEGKKASYRERKEKLMTYMQAVGSWTLPSLLAEKLAGELNVSSRQIYRDRLRIIRSVPKPDVKETAAKFLISFDQVMAEAASLIRDQDSLIKARGIDLFFKAIDTFTRFMESYGFKEKPEEKLKILGEMSEGNEASLMRILDKYLK